MYKGRRFTREQLVFVVRTVFRGAADQIQSSLPPSVPLDDARLREQSIRDYLHGVTNTVAIQLPILYAQLTDDGLGAGDFPQFGDFTDRASKYIERQLGRVKAPPLENGTFPDTDDLAEDFVDEFLADYIVGS
jgi:hypothetical protein